MKKAALLPLLLSLGLILGGCAAPAPASAGSSDEPAGLEALMASATSIKLSGDSAEIKGPGAAFSGGRLSISTGGSFLITGSLKNGCILVDTGEAKQDVNLILSAADIHCADGPGILIDRAGDTCIYVPEGSVSRVSSGQSSGELKAPENDEAGAAVYAHDDLEFAGPGELSLEGYINNGLGCRNDLKISGGSLDITAANTGLKGNESVSISGGLLKIRCMNDGIKTSDREKEGKGSVNISGGEIFVEQAGDQAIVSVRDINISGGSLLLSSARDGLKAGDKTFSGSVNISGGELFLCSGNDAIDANGGLNLSGGSLAALGKDKDIKCSVSASVPFYAGLLKAGEGQSLAVYSPSGELLFQLECPWEVKSAYISLPGLSSGDTCRVMTGAEPSALKESGSFTAG